MGPTLATNHANIAKATTARVMMMRLCFLLGKMLIVIILTVLTPEIMRLGRPVVGAATAAQG